MAFNILTLEIKFIIGIFVCRPQTSRIKKFRITKLHSIRLTTMRRIIANLTPIVTVIIRLIQNGNAI